MADNTTYLSTKDSKLTVTEDFVMLDLHASPNQTKTEANVSFFIDITKDPEEWGVPT